MNYHGSPFQAPFAHYSPPIVSLDTPQGAQHMFVNALDYVDFPPLSPVVDASSPLPPNGFPIMGTCTFETMPQATGMSERHLSKLQLMQQCPDSLPSGESSGRPGTEYVARESESMPWLPGMPGAEGAGDAATEMGRGSRTGRQPRATGRRLKVACTPCSDSHKKCDQGHPCRRCKMRGIEAHCLYLPTKGGRRTRRLDSEAAGRRGGDGEYMPSRTHDETAGLRREPSPVQLGSQQAGTSFMLPPVARPVAPPVSPSAWHIPPSVPSGIFYDGVSGHYGGNNI